MILPVKLSEYGFGPRSRLKGEKATGLKFARSMGEARNKVRSRIRIPFPCHVARELVLEIFGNVICDGRTRPVEG